MFSRNSLLTYAIAFFVILGINFLLPRLMPGDPLDAIYGNEALIAMTPDLKAHIIERFALDQGILEQFTAYIGAIFQGDLGHSYYYNAPVSEVVFSRLPWTLLLVSSALILSLIVGSALGVEAGWRRGKRADKIMLGSLMSLNGMPDYFVGILLLLLFGVTLGIMPLSGSVTPYADLSGFGYALDLLKHMALPVLAMTLTQVAGVFLLTRNTMISVIREPFIKLARAKGLSESRIKYHHAGRNSMLPVITRSGLMMTRITTETLFIELVFAYPGLGYLIYEALGTRDYPVIQGVFLVVALVVLGVNFLVDVIYPRIDPRVKNAY